MAMSYGEYKYGFWVCDHTVECAIEDGESRFRNIIYHLSVMTVLYIISIYAMAFKIRSRYRGGNGSSGDDS